MAKQKYSRTNVGLIQRAANTCEWVMRERARAHGELPGPVHYTNDFLDELADDASARAFRVARLMHPIND